MNVMFEKLMEGQEELRRSVVKLWEGQEELKSDIVGLKDEMVSLEKRAFGELGKIVMYVQEVDKKVELNGVRLDKIGLHLAELDEDAVGREEFNALEGRVCALEQG